MESEVWTPIFLDFKPKLRYNNDMRSTIKQIANNQLLDTEIAHFVANSNPEKYGVEDDKISTMFADLFIGDVLKAQGDKTEEIREREFKNWNTSHI
jgi:hypothetical protein